MRNRKIRETEQMIPVYGKPIVVINHVFLNHDSSVQDIFNLLTRSTFLSGNTNRNILNPVTLYNHSVIGSSVHVLEIMRDIESQGSTQQHNVICERVTLLSYFDTVISGVPVSIDKTSQ